MLGIYQSLDVFFGICGFCFVFDFGDGFGEFGVNIVQGCDATVAHVVQALLHLGVKDFVRFLESGHTFLLIVRHEYSIDNCLRINIIQLLCQIMTKMGLSGVFGHGVVDLGRGLGYI